MKILITFIASCAFSLAAVKEDPVQHRIQPWDSDQVLYHAYRQPIDSAGNPVGAPIPQPNVWVNMVIIDDEASGHHPHGANNERPPQIPVPTRALQSGESPIRLKTDANGDAWFGFKGNNFSGNVSILLTPDDITFDILKFNFYLGYVDFSKNGSTVTPKYLKPLQQYGETLTYSRHDDSRHIDEHGQYNNSRHGTEASLESMELIAHYYHIRHEGGPMLDVIRGSLPDGGCADNRMLAGAGTVYLYPEWSKKACNSYGVQWDIENPALEEGGVGTYAGDASWTLFEKVVTIIGKCEFAKLKDDGTPMPLPLTGLTGSWYHEPVARITCSSGPLVKPQ